MRGHVTVNAIAGDAELQNVLSRAGELVSLVSKVAARLEERWDASSGLLDRMCAHALVPSGKLFRPILLLESALAVGGDAEQVLPAAIGAECGHTASLVHDDIIDDDDLRRGRPSVQHKYGVDNAIVAGDALIFALFAALAECRATGVPPDRIVAALDVVARCGIDLCRGQSLESELCRRMDFDVDAYLTMVKLKTAALFRGACECGALLAGGDDSMVRALGTYAENLGTAFQIHDDLRSYTRNTEVMGKPDTSDIRNRRPTLPVLLAYESGDPVDRRAIKDVLSGDGDPVTRRDSLVKILEQTGALSAAYARGGQYVDNSVAALQPLPPSASRERLRGYAEAAIGPRGERREAMEPHCDRRSGAVAAVLGSSHEPSATPADEPVRPAGHSRHSAGRAGDEGQVPGVPVSHHGR
ncbi:polyprenyl synthetase family protein [Kutzneria sp. CA-103260]|uniref:polyprenyl synthetase family protein n=1 Tax=Kutzneria sp. CA-103260 TaxID=2802641 RepID=UPI001BA46258|nr:polyprenyl synthetase family protein [Kutzneria sp. CA-103260]QUQ65270.1 Polyprenyl synthetase [Kutzneria sp. CA-103260]